MSGWSFCFELNRRGLIDNCIWAQHNLRSVLRINEFRYWFARKLTMVECRRSCAKRLPIQNLSNREFSDHTS